MPMIWVKMDVGIWDNQKINDLATTCRLDIDKAASHWMRLVARVKQSEQHETGEIKISGSPATQIARLSHIPNEHAQSWMNALIKHKLIESVRDTNGHPIWRIHGWDDWYGVDNKRKAGQRQRTEKSRALDRADQALAHVQAGRQAGRNGYDLMPGERNSIRNTLPIVSVTRYREARNAAREEETRGIVTTPDTTSTPVVSNAADAKKNDPTEEPSAERPMPGQPKPGRETFTAADLKATERSLRMREETERMIAAGTCEPYREFIHRVTIRAGLTDYVTSSTDGAILRQAAKKDVPASDMADLFIAVATRKWGDPWKYDNLRVQNLLGWMFSWRRRNGGTNGTTGRSAGQMAGGPAGTTDAEPTGADIHAADAERRGADRIKAALARLAADGGIGADSPADGADHADA